MDAIRGLKTQEALFMLDTMRNKSALPVHKLLRCALNNAGQKSLEAELFVRHAYASRKKVLRRLEIKGRGRTGIREKPYCDITIILSSESGKQANQKAIKTDKVEAVNVQTETIAEKKISEKSTKSTKTKNKKEGIDGSKS